MMSYGYMRDKYSACENANHELKICLHAYILHNELSRRCMLQVSHAILQS